MGKANTLTSDHEGFRLVWTARRSEYEVNVYSIPGDQEPLGEPISELGYPKLFGSNLTAANEAFKAEAVSFAKREVDKQQLTSDN